MTCHPTQRGLTQRGWSSDLESTKSFPESIPESLVMAKMSLLLARRNGSFAFPNVDSFFTLGLHDFLSQDEFVYIVCTLNDAVKETAPSIGAMHGSMHTGLEAACICLNRMFFGHVNLRLISVPETEYFRIDMEVLISGKYNKLQIIG
eukprot:gene20103-26821_t